MMSKGREACAKVALESTCVFACKIAGWGAGGGSRIVLCIWNICYNERQMLLLGLDFGRDDTSKTSLPDFRWVSPPAGRNGAAAAASKNVPPPGMYIVEQASQASRTRSHATNPGCSRARSLLQDSNIRFSSRAASRGIT